MSALPAPKPLTPQEPTPLRPVTPVPEPPKRRWFFKIGLPGLGLLAGLFAIYALWLRTPDTGGGPPVLTIRTLQVAPGEFRKTFRVGGQTSARHFANITVPVMMGPDSRSNMTIQQLVKPGTIVKKGDPVAQIDAQTLKDHIDDMNDQVLQADNDLKKRLAEQAVDLENTAQTLRVAKSNWDKALLDVKAAEVKTDLEREMYRLSAEEAEVRYKQLQADVPQLKAEHQAELRILEIAQYRTTIHRDRHAGDLQKFSIVAPMNGLVVLQQIHRGGENATIQEGDMINPGQALAKVVDPSSMQVEAIINQAENVDFRIGQPARIGLDAFPEARFAGKIYSIGALAVRPGFRDNFYIRAVPLRIAIEGSDPRLIPDLSAWADIELERQQNVIVAPLEAIYTEGNRTYVYVKRGDRFEKRAVELGSRNQVQAVVSSGLNAGEQVALEQPPARDAK